MHCGCCLLLFVFVVFGYSVVVYLLMYVCGLSLVVGRCSLLSVGCWLLVVWLVGVCLILLVAG